MLALRFIKPLLVPGKFVPEAVEIDALPAGDQALHVLTTEAKVPHGRILCDLIPGSDAGQRRIDRHPSAHALGVGGGNCEADHDADVVRHQFGRTHTQRVQDAHHVRRLILLVVAAIRLRREAQPTQVGCDNHVVFDEFARQMTPHVARCAEAVQHDDRRTLPADAYVDLGAVRFDLTGLHTGWEGVDAILMSVVVHRFTPGLEGTWLRRRGRPGERAAFGHGSPAWTAGLLSTWRCSSRPPHLGRGTTLALPGGPSRPWNTLARHTSNERSAHARSSGI